LYIVEGQKLTNEDFNILYQNKEFLNKFKSICNDIFQSNREALSAFAIFAVDDLEQEGLIKIWKAKAGEKTSYYLKIAQNRLLKLVDRGESRNDIIQFEPLDDNLAYGIYEEEY